MTRIRGKCEQNEVLHGENSLYMEEDDMVVEKIGGERVEKVRMLEEVRSRKEERGGVEERRGSEKDQEVSF